MDATTPPAKPAQPSLADLIHEANFAVRSLDPLATLASTQIQLKEFDRAQITIERLHNLLEGNFKKYFDQDPLEAFPDYQAKYFSLSARLLAKAERKKCGRAWALSAGDYKSSISTANMAATCCRIPRAMETNRRHGGRLGNLLQSSPAAGGSAHRTHSPFPCGSRSSL